MKPSVKGQPSIKRRLSGETHMQRPKTKMTMGKAGASTVTPQNMSPVKGR